MGFQQLNAAYNTSLYSLRYAYLGHASTWYSSYAWKCLASMLLCFLHFWHCWRSTLGGFTETKMLHPRRKCKCHCQKCILEVCFYLLYVINVRYNGIDSTSYLHFLFFKMLKILSLNISFMIFNVKLLFASLYC